DFYAQDLRMLRRAGFDVKIATSPLDLCRADLYFAWWWTWAFCPLAFSLGQRPLVITGVFNHWSFPGRPAHERWLMDLASRCAAANVFTSRVELDAVPRLVPATNPRYIPLGVDVAKFSP